MALRAGFVLALPLCAAAGCKGDDDDLKDCQDTPGVMCTWAGTGRLALGAEGQAPDDTSLYWPVDVTFSELGTYLLDWNNHRVLHLTDDDTFETVIGTDFVGDGPDDLSDQMPPGALGTEVTLNHPTQLVAMPDGKMTLVAWHNHKLRTYDPDTGLVVVTCGGPAGYAGDGGPAKMARLDQPSSLVVGSDGTQYIVDQRNQIIRTIAADGTVGTLAGTPMMLGFEGDGAEALKAKFHFPEGSNPRPGGGLALSEDESVLYVSDTLNHRIRAIDLEDGTIETIAGTGDAGFAGDGGKALKAKLNFPRKLTLGPDGRLYVGDQDNDRIRAIDLDSGEIETVAGAGARGFSGDGLLPTETSLDRPTGVSFDDDGTMYVIDTFNSRVRRVTPENAP
jgi:DNA-binding beta-propeller fold protein YncE